MCRTSQLTKMRCTEVLKFSSFTLEVNKASQNVWGFSKWANPHKDIYEVAICINDQIFACPLYQRYIYLITKQLDPHRLRTKTVITYTPPELFAYTIPRSLGRQMPIVFTSSDRDLWLDYFRDKDILSHDNVPLTIDSRFHLIPFAAHLRIRSQLSTKSGV